jgi:hypothetical protein
MAKSARKGPSASQAIRDYCRDNPDKSPKEVAAELVSRGFATVTAAYVSTIKSLAKKAASEGGAGKSAEAESPTKAAAKAGAKRGRKPRAADSAASVPASSPTRGAGAKGRKAAEASTSEITIDALLQAKKLAALLGGVAKAQAALDALAKLGG